MRRLLRDILWVIRARLTRKKKIVCFGTSLTEGSGWVKMLQKELPEYHVINFGKGGMNSNWGVKNLKWVLWFKPEIVLMEFAINDASILTEYYKPVNQFQSSINLQRMIYDFKVNGIEVYLMVMNPPLDINIYERNPAEDRPEYNEYYELHKAIAIINNIPFIDLTAEWNKLSREDFLWFCPDGLHPNELGSRGITVPTILKQLNKI